MLRHSIWWETNLNEKYKNRLRLTKADSMNYALDNTVSCTLAWFTKFLDLFCTTFEVSKPKELNSPPLENKFLFPSKPHLPMMSRLLSRARNLQSFGLNFSEIARLPRALRVTHWCYWYTVLLTLSHMKRGKSQREYSVIASPNLFLKLTPGKVLKKSCQKPLSGGM